MCSFMPVMLEWDKGLFLVISETLCDLYLVYTPELQAPCEPHCLHCCHSPYCSWIRGRMTSQLVPVSGDLLGLQFLSYHEFFLFHLSLPLTVQRHWCSAYRGQLSSLSQARELAAAIYWLLDGADDSACAFVSLLTSGDYSLPWWRLKELTYGGIQCVFGMSIKHNSSHKVGIWVCVH